MDNGMVGKRQTRCAGPAVLGTLLLVIAGLLVAGCGPGTDAAPTPMGGAREPFASTRETGDGAVVGWEGYTGGYDPGAEASFDITIKNESKETWQGRFCLQLLDRQMPQVIATLEQRPFVLEPGMGFSDQITVQFPHELDEGAYGLSLAVRRPAGPVVDLVPVQVGESDEVRRPTTQQDMDASLEACPPVASAALDSGPLVEQAQAGLARRLGVDLAEIEVESVEEARFPDASLGVPEPDTAYAQVITPGYIIELAVGDRVYTYHASEERVVFVPEESGSPQGSLTMETV